MNRIFFIILQSVVFAVFLEFANGFGVERRSAAPERFSDDYSDYQLGVKYDEYPMIVPKKRTALLVNRLMVALKEKMDEEDRRNQKINYDYKDYPSMTPEDIRSMDLQRRGHNANGQQKSRYWRCYFNAVTCF